LGKQTVKRCLIGGVGLRRVMAITISVGGGDRELQPLPTKQGRNPFYSGNFSERTIWNMGRKFTESLQPL